MKCLQNSACLSQSDLSIIKRPFQVWDSNNEYATNITDIDKTDSQEVLSLHLSLMWNHDIFDLRRIFEVMKLCRNSPFAVPNVNTCISIKANNLFILLHYGKTWGGFCLNTAKRFSLEVSLYNQQKEDRLFSKTVLGIFKIALRFRDQHVFM